jgi:DNA modification methylase
MKIEKIEISKLKPATYNPRQITKKQYNDLKDSLDKFSLVEPIVVNKDMTIIGGHQRYKIWKENAEQSNVDDITIPCVVLDLNKEQERELNIRLNKSGGEWDMDILANEFDIEELKEWGFKDIEFGFNIDKITEGNTEDDHIPEVKESRVKLGDVWELGNHRLMCGDSTKESDVEKLMNKQKADMVFTDPPYGIKHSGKGIKGKTKENNFGEILNDNDVSVAINSFQLINNMFYGSTLIFWGANYYSNILPNGYGWLIWDKQKEGDTFSGGEIAFVNKGVKVNIFRHQWHGMIKASERGQKRIHPTQKPIALAEYCFKEYGNPKIVLDIFLGSGSTLIACEKTNRICYGMELDAKYCDVIIERWEQFTGQKAKKL